MLRLLVFWVLFLSAASLQAVAQLAGPSVPSYNPGVPSYNPGIPRQAPGMVFPQAPPRYNPGIPPGRFPGGPGGVPIYPYAGPIVVVPQAVIVTPPRRRSTMDNPFFGDLGDPFF
jgi:hypothetical protein